MDITANTVNLAEVAQQQAELTMEQKIDFLYETVSGLMQMLDQAANSGGMNGMMLKGMGF